MITHEQSADTTVKNDDVECHARTDDRPTPHPEAATAHNAHAYCKALRDLLLTETFTVETSPLYDKPGNYIVPVLSDEGVRLDLTLVGSNLASARKFSLHFKEHKNTIHFYAKLDGHNFLIDANAYGILTALFGYTLDKRSVLFKLTDGIFILTNGMGKLPTIFSVDKLVLTASKDIEKVGLLASLASAHYRLNGKRYLPVQEEVFNGKRYTYLRELSNE